MFLLSFESEEPEHPHAATTIATKRNTISFIGYLSDELFNGPG